MSIDLRARRLGLSVPRMPRLRLIAALLIVMALVLPTAMADPASDQDQSGQWAYTTGAARLMSEPDDGSQLFGTVNPLNSLEILGYQDDWAYVYNPRTRGTAWVHSDVLGPGDPPSHYVTDEPPAVEQEMDKTAWLTGMANLQYYPSPSPDATDGKAYSGGTVEVTGSLHGEDGELWYRTADGDYISADAVFFPSAPQLFGGRWIDVNLSEPARLTAYEGGVAVHSNLVIKGRQPRPTPTGTFSILRRVANETMDSSTIGIPRNGPGGYYLTGVLYTQYFTNDGASLHYNYWSSNFGYAGSHGCLGMTLADSKFMWDWAGVGTPLSIHF